jgi:phosphotriesterase-related protein
MSSLMTTLGPKNESEIDAGMLLPHEHVFVDLRIPTAPDHAQAEVGDVIRLMAPELVRARSAGITTLVECTPEGVGRRVDILKAVSAAAQYPLVVSTGIYREPWVPAWAYAASEEELQTWMQSELEAGIRNTGVKAGFIKLSASDNGLTPVETKILRAAARAASGVNAAIASHTVQGKVALEQLAIIEACGYRANRFIWVHAHLEPDFQLHLEIARRGAWIEYDGIGWEDNDSLFIDLVQRMLGEGFKDQLLLSQDRGWYDAAQPGGGIPRPFTYLPEVFLPKLRATGIGDEVIRQITRDNPFRAFARN